MLRQGPTFAGKEDGDEVNESWRLLQFLFTGAGLHAGAMHETAGVALAGKSDSAMLERTNQVNINPTKPNTILAGRVIPPPVSNMVTPHSGQMCCVFMYSTLKNRLASSRSVHSR